VSFSNTGTATITLDQFVDSLNDCERCVKGYGCITYYEVADCCGIVPNGVMLLPDNLDLTIVYLDTAETCWSIVGPTVGPATVVWNGYNKESCNNCICG
jgi:hypothetical protein